MTRSAPISASYGPNVRNDRPFGGPSPPAALFHYSRDRSGEHLHDYLAYYNGIMKACSYARYDELLKSERSAGLVARALCWTHHGASSPFSPTSPPW
ncbi:IS66 family transposase (plasmid) [Polymorphobacter megasporae]|nr:IS66 family transposase [Polymorphobacter megasporae]